MEKEGSPWLHAPTARVGGKTVRLFQCLYCDKTFLKSQALGGHQNAHRKDRVGGGLNDPYADDSLFFTAASTGPSMYTSVVSHGAGAGAGAAAWTPAAHGGRPERWGWGGGGASLRLADGAVGLSSAGKALDLELRL